MTEKAKVRAHFKCAACKTFYITRNKAEAHIFRKHHGMGIIVFDEKGKLNAKA